MFVGLWGFHPLIIFQRSSRSRGHTRAANNFPENIRDIASPYRSLYLNELFLGFLYLVYYSLFRVHRDLCDLELIPFLSTILIRL